MNQGKPKSVPIGEGAYICSMPFDPVTVYVIAVSATCCRSTQQPGAGLRLQGNLHLEPRVKVE